MMSRNTALSTALSLQKMPTMLRYLHAEPLPPGITQVLEIAAGVPGAIESGAKASSHSPTDVEAAAEFFIEQVLFRGDADAYTILGASPDTPATELRRNMALLMKWVHPDTAEADGATGAVDRSVFARRVVEAWDSVKSADRRAAYNASRRADRPAFDTWPRPGNGQAVARKAQRTEVRANGAAKSKVRTPTGQKRLRHPGHASGHRPHQSIRGAMPPPKPNPLGDLLDHLRRLFRGDRP